MVVLEGGAVSCERGTPVHVGGSEGAGQLTHSKMFTRAGQENRPTAFVRFLNSNRTGTDRFRAFFLIPENEGRLVMLAVFLN